MRLLTRDDAGQICVTEDVAESRLPPYAVLSHTWGKDQEEVTLQDIRNKRAARKAGYAKIKFCLEQAERDGMRHCWIDTCCIDKTNQAELSKSIVSMFRWYKNAEKCYVYLSDVPSQSGQSAESDLINLFRASRWFRRGWTLQELLAPVDVVLFNSKGEPLGTKISLAREISVVTQIPATVIQSNSLTEFTTAERFSWQQGRETREPEDLAYSMLGLLDVSMAIIYGEGYAKARQRLEEEITKALKGIQHDKFTITPSLNDVIQVQQFVGRKQELEVIRNALRSDGSRRFVTVHGLGGIGKTQLALQYAIRYKDLYTTILWLNIDSKDSVTTSFVKMAKHLLSQPNGSRLGMDISETNTDSIVEAVKKWLGQPHNTRWLMIFDNYDNPKVSESTLSSQVNIQDYLPSAHQGSVIITTRSTRVNLGQVIHLQKLESVHESIELLSTTSGRENIGQDPNIELLIHELDGLPLALATAGAYLSQTAMSPERYLQLYRTSWAKLQQTSTGLNTYEDRKLFSTWQITFDQIRQRNPLSANFLRVSAYFGNEDIWLQLLQHYNEEDPPWIAELVQDELDFEEAMQTLCDYSLVEKANTSAHRTESSGYSMHKCVHAWTKSVIQAEEDQALAQYAFCCVAAHVPELNENEWWITQRRLLNHASVCTHDAIQHNECSDLLWGWHNFGLLYHNQGQLSRAEAMYQRALIGFETALGVEHVSTLTTVHNLGDLYAKQGKLSSAEAMYQRALAGCETALGVDHVSTLDTVHNLGILYAEQGKLSSAEAMYQRALAGFETALGVDHVSTLDTVHNLGDLYAKQGKLSSAEAMYQRALAGCKTVLGVDHVSTLDTVHNLGNLYAKQGRLSSAEAMYQQALAGCETALGVEHVSTLTTVHDLGDLYAKQGKLSSAEAMYQRALAGFETALGLDHVSTLDTVHSLGNLYAIQGELNKAEAMYQRVLTSYKKDPMAYANRIRETENAVASIRAAHTPRNKKPRAFRRLLKFVKH